MLEQYNTDIEGEVVDIGANVGDSSLYFAAKGASHVYVPMSGLIPTYVILFQGMSVMYFTLYVLKFTVIEYTHK